MTREPLYTVRRIFDCDKPTADAVDEFARSRNLRRAEAMRQLLRLGLEAANK